MSILCDDRFSFNVKYKNFRNANYEGIESEIAVTDWNSIFRDLDCNSKVQKFYETINLLNDKYVPVTYKKHKDFPSWFSRELESTIFEKNRGHWHYKL